jgi:hypothetical protein
VDFTGGPAFGRWLREHVAGRKCCTPRKPGSTRWSCTPPPTSRG